jgi:hypothetical protein
MTLTLTLDMTLEEFIRRCSAYKLRHSAQEGICPWRVRVRARDAAACGAACRRGSPAELRVTGALAHILNVPQARLPLGSPHVVA